jgi:hypothetical protein
VRNVYKTLVRKPEWKIVLGRPRRGWADNTKMGLREEVIGAWVEFMWLRVGMMTGCCEYSNEHIGSLKAEYFLCI